MNHQRNRIFLYFTTLIVAVIVATVTLRGQSKDVACCEMTPKQKEHSKLYKKEFENRRDKKIKDIAASGVGDVSVVIMAEGGIDSPYTPPFNLSSFLEKSACEADAIIVGTVKSKDSQLTEDGEFIFTDYEMSVSQVLKDNAAASISIGSDITVTRAGGEMRLNGRKVTATSEYFEPLTVGEQYLLFLRFIPATGAYKAYNNRGSFQLRNNKIIALTKESLPGELRSGNDATSFLSNVRIASGGRCGEQDERKQK